jgi:hypothetical protein
MTQLVVTTGAYAFPPSRVLLEPVGEFANSTQPHPEDGDTAGSSSSMQRPAEVLHQQVQAHAVTG